MSGDPTETPFAALRLNARSTPEAITDAMRELAEEADPEDRRRLQGQWRALTLHPVDRLRAAFFSHAAPARDLPDPLDPRARRRLKLTTTHAATPQALQPDSPPALADLVLLPALRQTAASPSEPRPDDGAHVGQRAGQTPWPDIDPADDVLLKL